MKRFLWLGFVLFLYPDLYRVRRHFPPDYHPESSHLSQPGGGAFTVLSINDNGTVVPGTAMVIDVSGDTDVSVANVGLAPVHAVQQSANQVLVVNHSVTGALQDSITKLDLQQHASSAAHDHHQSAAEFGAKLCGDHRGKPRPTCCCPTYTEVERGQHQLAIAWSTTIPVGNNPVAMAETPDAKKLYVANQDDSTISGFNTVDRSSRTVSGSFQRAALGDCALR
jgi:hypothetical protein